MKTNLSKLAKQRIENHEYPEDLRDLRADIYRDYLKFKNKLISDGLNKVSGDFYLTIITEVHKDIEDKNCYSFKGRACRGVESPRFHCDVWKYHRDMGKSSLLWTLPTRKNAFYLKKHRHEVLPEYYPMLSYVLDYYDGKLHKLCEEENEKAAKAIYG